MNSLEALHQHVGHLLSTKQVRATLTGALALSFFAACHSPVNISKEAVSAASEAMSEILTVKTGQGQHVLRTMPAQLNQKDRETSDGLVSLTENEVIFAGSQGQANILFDDISALESTEHESITKIYISTYKTPPFVLSFQTIHSGLAKRFMDDLSNLVMMSRQGAVSPTPASLAAWNQSNRVVSKDSASADDLDLADQLEAPIARIKVYVERASDPLHGGTESKTAVLTNTRLRLFNERGTYQIMLSDLGSLTLDKRLGFMYAIADGDYPVVLKPYSNNTAGLQELEDFFQKLQDLTIINRTTQVVVTPEVAKNIIPLTDLPVANTAIDLRSMGEERRYSVAAQMDRKGDGDTFYSKRRGQLTITNRRLVFTVSDSKKEVIYQIPLSDITRETFKTASELGRDDVIELQNGGDYPISIFLPMQSRDQSRRIFEDITSMKQELQNIWKPQVTEARPSPLADTANVTPQASSGRLQAHLSEIGGRHGLPVPQIGPTKISR